MNCKNIRYETKKDGKGKLDAHHGQSTAQVLTQPSCNDTTTIRFIS